MAGKPRVHELAKQLDVTSKEVLAWLNEHGEFVKSASSTVEAPVARRLKEAFGSAKGGAPEAPRPTAAKPSAGPKPGGPRPGPKPAARAAAPAAPAAPARKQTNP